MAITSINGPATVSNPATATAVRNPTYNAGGTIIGSSPTPGGLPTLPVNNVARGRMRSILQQLALMNRSDPREAMSLNEEELRRAALQRLRGGQ